MLQDGVELQDAVLESVAFDVVAKHGEIRLQFYRNSTDNFRVPARISFSDVQNFSMIGNVSELEANAGPGNVSYWRQSDRDTAIYLVDGCVLVTAGRTDVSMCAISQEV
ncbi:MAG TPA: hypothetical protein VGI79_18915 [Caulobacteraceae bacterium]